jgi:hypothetical protein
MHSRQTAIGIKERDPTTASKTSGRTPGTETLCAITSVTSEAVVFVRVT